MGWQWWIISLTPEKVYMEVEILEYPLRYSFKNMELASKSIFSSSGVLGAGGVFWQDKVGA